MIEASLQNGNRDYWTFEAMSKLGGSFVKALAEAGHHADPENLRRIKTTWPEYWEEYKELGRRLESNYEKEYGNR